MDRVGPYTNSSSSNLSRSVINPFYDRRRVNVVARGLKGVMVGVEGVGRTRAHWVEAQSGDDRLVKSFPATGLEKEDSTMSWKLNEKKRKIVEEKEAPTILLLQSFLLQRTSTGSHFQATDYMPKHHLH